MADENKPQTPPEQQTPAELQKTITQVQQTAAAGDRATPLEVKLSTGHVFRGNTQDELLAELTKAQEHATKLIKEQRDELERLKTETAPPPAAPKPTDTYDPNVYYQIWQQDPLKAQQYVDSFDPAKQMMWQTISRMQYQADLDHFKQTVGFYPDEDQAKAFTKEFIASGLQPNKDNYELVYYRMVNQQKIEPTVRQIRGQGSPPPSINGGGSPPPGFDMDQFQSLPADQQAQVIDRLRKQGWT